MTDERTEQAMSQCRVVSHFAKAIVELADARARAIDNNPSLVEQIGRSTAYQMEALGDMLNGMDAVTADDEWTAPIFEKAHKMWPPQEPR